MIIGFTGTQDGMTVWQEKEVERFLVELNCSVLVHGSCVGADFHADQIADRLEIKRKIRPCNIKEKRARCELRGAEQIAEPIAPLVRNHKIVDDCALLIACPKGMSEELRSGTWATIRYARKIGKEVIIVWPEDSE